MYTYIQSKLFFGRGQVQDPPLLGNDLAINSAQEFGSCFYRAWDKKTQNERFCLLLSNLPQLPGPSLMPGGGRCVSPSLPLLQREVGTGDRILGSVPHFPA